MVRNQPICKTILLDDDPAQKDDFGSHQRIANAIADLLESEHGGRVIALEGVWGSGKSTVVNLVRSELEKDNQYQVVSFDAWAHEGDPLRRTFLESVASALNKNKWLSLESYKEKLDKITNRHIRTKTRSYSSPTLLGGVFAITLFFIPVGGVLFSASLRSNSSSLFGSLPLQIIFGLLTISPMLILFVNLVLSAIKRVFSKRPFSSRDWEFISKDTKRETETESIETPDPTSIEFENIFTEIMREALPREGDRKLLIVLDNLDRVDSAYALKIWSTLQTYLQERNASKEIWFRKVWVLVPYDPVSIRKLWDRASNTNSSTIETQKNPGSYTRIMPTNSFLDKTFQIKFQVPTPVLSDWKHYLYNLLEKALPQHNEVDRHSIYRVYDEYLREGTKLPCPRDLKLYVNQIGAIHRQWLHEFPIDHVAYYVLHCQYPQSFISCLRDGAIPKERDKRYLMPNPKRSLAGLSFNVPERKGMELLLAEPIYGALSQANHESLIELADQNQEGFWAILENVLLNRISDTEPSLTSSIAIALSNSQLLNNNFSQEAQSIKTLLKKIGASTKDWSPLDESIANGVDAMFRLVQDNSFAKKIVDNIRVTLDGMGTVNEQEKTEENLDVVGKSLVIIIRSLKQQHVTKITQPLTIPGSGRGWINACNEFSSTSEAEYLLDLISTKADFDEISQVIQEDIESGNFCSASIKAIHVTSLYFEQIEWGQTIVVLQSRLDPAHNPEVRTGELQYILKGLWLLRELEKEGAEAALAELVSTGHLAHHFPQIVDDCNDKCEALAMLTLMFGNPDLSNPPAVAQSASGQKVILDEIEHPDRHKAELLCATLKHYRCTRLLFETISKREAPDPLFATCVHIFAESRTYHNIYTADLIFSYWREIQPILDEGENEPSFSKLITLLVNEHVFCKDILNKIDQLTPSLAPLYRVIVNSAGGGCSEFYDWCRQKLGALDKSDWQADMDNQCEYIRLALSLTHHNGGIHLTTNLADALEENAVQVAKAECEPDDQLIENAFKALSLLETGAREALRQRLLNIAIDTNGNLAVPFLQMYGSVICTVKPISENKRVLNGCFDPIVQRRNVPCLKWLVNFFESNDDFRKAARRRKSGFKTRLADYNGVSQTDTAQELINNLAQLLGQNGTSNR